MAYRLLVVGGGIGGLTLAALLEREVPRVEVTLVERAAAWAPVGAGISLTGNALRQLDRLGIVDALAERGVALRGMRIADARGRVLSATDIRRAASGRDAFTNRVVAIHRAELHEVLCASVAHSRILLGTEPREFVETTNGVEVELSTGERDCWDLVVGADGVNSRVRDEVLRERNDPFHYAGYTCWRSIVPMAESELHDEAFAWELWGRGRRFGVVPVGRGRIYFYACVNAPRDDASMATAGHRELAGLFGGLGGPVPEVLTAIARSDGETVLFQDDLGDVRIDRWSRGRFVLIGDAAHATTPNLGQGAALAIEDAAVLTELLSAALQAGRGGHEVLEEFEARRRERVELLQQRAWSLGGVAQWESPWRCWLRDTLTRCVPSGLAQRQLREVVDELP